MHGVLDMIACFAGQQNKSTLLLLYVLNGKSLCSDIRITVTISSSIIIYMAGGTVM